MAIDLAIQAERARLRSLAFKQAQKLAFIHDPSGKKFSIPAVIKNANGEVITAPTTVEALFEGINPGRLAAIQQQEAPSPQGRGGFNGRSRGRGQLRGRGGRTFQRNAYDASEPVPASALVVETETRPVLPKDVEIPVGEEDYISLWDLSDDALKQRMMPSTAEPQIKKQKVSALAEKRTEKENSKRKRDEEYTKEDSQREDEEQAKNEAAAAAKEQKKKAKKEKKQKEKAADSEMKPVEKIDTSLTNGDASNQLSKKDKKDKKDKKERREGNLDKTEKKEKLKMPTQNGTSTTTPSPSLKRFRSPSPEATGTKEIKEAKEPAPKAKQLPSLDSSDNPDSSNSSVYHSVDEKKTSILATKRKIDTNEDDEVEKVSSKRSKKLKHDERKRRKEDKKAAKAAEGLSEKLKEKKRKEKKEKGTASEDLITTTADVTSDNKRKAEKYEHKHAKREVKRKIEAEAGAEPTTKKSQKAKSEAVDVETPEGKTAKAAKKEAKAETKKLKRNTAEAETSLEAPTKRVKTFSSSSDSTASKKRKASKEVPAAVWNASLLPGDEARKSKFLRLLGGARSGIVEPHIATATESGSAASLEKAQKELEKQFDDGVRMKSEGRKKGLGAF